MTRFDSMVIGSELVSEHYLAEEFPARVRAVRAIWAEREEFGKQTPRRGLTALSGRLTGDLVTLRETTGPQHDDLLRGVYARVREALGIDGPRTSWAFERAADDLRVDAVVHRTPSGPHVIILEARDAATVEDILDGEGAGHLLSPVRPVNDLDDGAGDSGPEQHRMTQTTKAVSALFLATHPVPPALIVVQAGGWLLVAERSRWAEGRWLAVDLATAADRRDARAAGELETVAALIGADALLPADDASCGFTDMLSASITHAVGVSKDLRDGVRESIEFIATEVLRRRRACGITDDDTPDLSKTLTRHALRYLYRILFLLYAEARPELGVLPVGSPEYAAGYGLDRLRDLCLTELTTQHARDGQHLYLSLAQLFTRVDQGYMPPDGGQDSLRFEALSADLFQAGATALIDEVGLGNAALQAVLARLLLSRKQAKRERGFVSYAQLGINQLGAVYEGLMSYTGFLAWDDLYEVAKDGDPDKGSWLVRVRGFEASGIDPSHRVFREDPETGERKPVRYQRGDYVLRLSGRDRQRSASYYTPQVLTACVVRHSLAELLDQPAPDDPDGGKVITPARDLLDLRICEPALGSGAFLVEALDQLAGEYLTRAQAEAGRTIPPERYPAELQKVKAYLALHCCYGVDLNATAVELAEISLWLTSMHPGLQAPWFGLRLRRGNSLIGARRSVYSPSDYAKALWWKTIPVDRSFADREGEGRLRDGEVHHFLLPSEGWGAVADTKEANELRPDETLALKEWRKETRRAPSAPDQKRLAALASRAETLWNLAAIRLEIAEAESRRDIDVWGAGSLPRSNGAVSREKIEISLADENGAYRRLRRVMDAWAALWFWPVTSDAQPPGWDEWLDALEGLLGIEVKAPHPKIGRVEKRLTQLRKEDRILPGFGQVDAFAGDTTWETLKNDEDTDLTLARARPVEGVLARHAWLRECARISEKEGFFHWELDFAPVFEVGGFDLQLGNPPWVRPDWDDNLVLAESDPWFGLAVKPTVKDLDRRRRTLLSYERSAKIYLDERASLSGLSAHLGSETDRPILSGLRPDLYRCFIERTWRSMSVTGIAGLIHPESHFTEARAGDFRQAIYEHLRRHWNMRNELKLFDINHTREFGVSVYGRSRQVSFLNMASIYAPETVDQSLLHDGSGPEAGIKDDDDRWDTRAHSGRLIRVDEDSLAVWAKLIDPPGSPVRQARMLRPVNTASQETLAKLAEAPRFGETIFEWTSGWNEKTDRQAGFFVAESRVPTAWNLTILQGPHFGVANPFAKQPNATMRNNLDWSPWNLEDVSERALPRTSYQPAKPIPEYLAGYPRWNGRSASDFFRLVWRRMADSSTERTLHAALIPPGPTHVNTVLAITGEPRNLALAVGMWSSIPSDFFVKVSGSTELKTNVVTRIAHPADHPLVSELIHRALRLNCITADYAPLWQALFEDRWGQDTWKLETSTDPKHYQPADLGDVREVWTMATPLRKDFDRRQALVEIDALAAIMLGITARELCAIYRTQFGVLRKYERQNWYDANGRKVPGDIAKAYQTWVNSGSTSRLPDLGRYKPPFIALDREVDMTRAHIEFTRSLALRT